MIWCILMALRPNLFVTVYTNTLYIIYIIYTIYSIYISPGYELIRARGERLHSRREGGISGDCATRCDRDSK